MDRQEKRKNEGTTENGNASDGTPDNSDHEDKVSIKKFKNLPFFDLQKYEKIIVRFPVHSHNSQEMDESYSRNSKNKSFTNSTHIKFSCW